MSTTPPTDDPYGGLTRRLKKTSFAWLLIRGILAIILGLILFFAPITGGVVMAIFVVVAIGVWLIFDGFATVPLAFRHKREGAHGWGWTLAAGIVAIVAGVLALIFPLAMGLYLGLLVLYFLAFGLIIRGVIELGSRALGGWGIALGVINILFGVIIVIFAFINPVGSLLALAWLVGIYAIIFGVVSIATAVRVRKLR